MWYTRSIRIRNLKHLNRLLIGLVLFNLSCAKQPSGSRELVISLEKTPCYGFCPVYTIEIYDDLSVMYRGERNVPLEGEHIFRIKSKELDGLVNSFLEADFFEFESDYTRPVTDLPTTYIRFTHNGESKKIRDYSGAPEKLKELEAKVEDFVKKKIWKESD